jgi:cytochrome c5
MSQGTSGSTKLMLIVWAIAMIFIGFKALNSTSGDSSNSETMVENSVLERIKPVGEVRIDTSTQVASAEIVETAVRSGEEIYNSKCAGCHTSGVMGSPKFASLEDWAPRVGPWARKTHLISNSWKGRNAS